MVTEQSRENRLSAAFVRLATPLTDGRDITYLLHALIDECMTVLNVDAGLAMLVAQGGEPPVVVSHSVGEADSLENTQRDAIPLRVREETVGVMNLFCTRSGGLDALDVATARALADVATIGIVQERLIRGREAKAVRLQRILNERVVIEQAKGFASEIRGRGIAEASAALQQHAQTNNQRPQKVAKAVLRRQLSVAELPAAAPLSPTAVNRAAR